MDRRQTILLVGLMVLVFAGIIAAAYFVQGSSGGAGGSTIDSTRRFTAKSGTSRDNAVALTSSKRKSTGSVAAGGRGSPAGGAGTSDGLEPLQPLKQPEREKPIAIRSLSRPENEEQLSAGERAIREAKNSLNSEKAIERLESMLDANAAPGDASALHRALGELYSQRQPPDRASAQAAFDRAQALATTNAERHEALLAEASALVAAGERELARIKLSTTLDTHASDSAAGLQLGILNAQLHEGFGEHDEAETIYRNIVERAQAMDPAESDEALRLAGLRLTALLRAQDRNDEADVLTAELGRHLSRTEP